MEIEKLMLYVTDIDKNANFYAKYFGAQIKSFYQDADRKECTLTFINGMTLVLLCRKEYKKLLSYLAGIKYTQLSFPVSSRQEIYDLTLNMMDEGYDVLYEPRLMGNTYESCIIGPDQTSVRIYQHLL